MKKLEDIPKKTIFEVPDGYFDKLPSAIQARVASKQPVLSPRFSYALRFAVPALVLALVAVIWFRPSTQPKTAEDILAGIQTEALIDYLANSEMRLEEMINASDFSEEDVAAIEGAVYDIQLDDEVLDGLADDYDFELND